MRTYFAHNPELGPLTDPLPAGVQPLFWTTNHTNLWADPPTPAQLDALTSLALHGGVSPAGDGIAYPAGTPLLLDNEIQMNRGDDATIADAVRGLRQRSSTTKLAVYALPLSNDPGNFERWASREPALWDSCRARAVAIAPLVKQLNALVIEIYPQQAGRDYVVLAAIRECLRAVRAAYPGKPVWAITRGDRGATGNVDLLDPAMTADYARFLRQFSAVIFWGSVSASLPLMRALAAAR